MYKRIYILIGVLFSLVVSSCTKDDDFFSAPGLGRTLIDTTLNVSQREVTVTLSEGITVTVPKDITGMSVNLKGPIIIQVDQKKACQVIVDGEEYALKYPIYELLKSRKEGEQNVGINQKKERVHYHSQQY